MSQEKKEYIRKRRKSLLIAIALLIFFGGVLFGLSQFNKKMNSGVVSSGGLYNIAGKLKKSLNTGDEKSRNILKKPVKVRFSYNDTKGQLDVKSSLRVDGKNIDNAVFYLKEHKDMLYSYDFISDDENVFCRGVMKKSEDYFFVYYCSDSRN
jgi:hypothetical protein